MGEVIRKVKAGRFLGWYLRYRDADGRRKQRASHQPSHALARRMLIEIEARIARGQVGMEEPQAQANALTVADVCGRYLIEFASPRIKNMDRYRAYSTTALRRILPHLGHIPAAELYAEQVAKARDAVARQYPPGTVRTTLIPLSAALSWAVRQKLIANNPVKGLERPRTEQHIEWLDADEVRRLLTEIETRARTRKGNVGLMYWSRWVAISLGVFAGLRRGEIFGLRWQDVDEETQRLTVAHSYATSPKNGQTRHLRLPSALLPMLREWRQRCPKTAKGWVCPVVHKERWGMSGDRTLHGLPILLRAAGCKPLRRCWHALRHSFASHYVMAGGNILSLQKILGHADIKMTLVYAHLAPDYLGAEMERVKF